MVQCRFICHNGNRCAHGASIDGLCITHYCMDNGIPKSKHIDYKRYNITIELWQK